MTGGKGFPLRENTVESRQFSKAAGQEDVRSSGGPWVDSPLIVVEVAQINMVLPREASNSVHDTNYAMFNYCYANRWS